LPRLSDGVAHASRCPASPQRTLRAENLGKPSMGHDQRPLVLHHLRDDNSFSDLGSKTSTVHKESREEKESSYPTRDFRVA
ncbi:MAG: hypothetical protein IID50_13880, partial [Proteobacteria bacterium]|nr:hypothetical protein [Pseudomonadota bacterium]